MAAAPLPAPTINRAPLGLLGFLGIKNGGRYPDVLSNVLLPTWDLQGLYEIAGIDYLTATQAAATAPGGFQPFITLGNGFLAHVHAASAYTDLLTAGDLASFALAVRPAGQTTWVIMSHPVDLLGSTAGNAGSTATTRNFYLAPGDTVGIYVISFAGAFNVTVSLRLSVMSNR